MTDTVEQFIELFQGNPHAIGTEEGGCHRLDPDYEYVADHIEKHLTGAGPPIGIYPMRNFDPKGPQSMWGANPHWCVHWGCIDFDEGEQESLVHATNVERVLSHFDIAGWIERSRSKGYHVWVFLDSWLPATLVREALLAACQLVDAPTREINPKQTELQGLQIGNYVRLMYPGGLSEHSGLDQGELSLAGGADRGGRELLHQQTKRPPSELHPILPADDGQGRSRPSQGDYWHGWCGPCGSQIKSVATRRPFGGSGEGHVPLAHTRRGPGGSTDVGDLAVDGQPSTRQDQRMPGRVVIDTETQATFCLNCFVRFAYADRTSQEQLQQLQRYYMPPQRPAQRQWDQVLTGTSTERLFGKTRIIWEKGPLDGSDRSDTLWKLARYIYEDGKHTPQEAFDLLVDADARWGKFANRPDRDQRLQQLVDKAWG